MTLYGWNEGEDAALQGLHPIAQSLYLRGFRTLPVGDGLVTETSFDNLAMVVGLSCSRATEFVGALCKRGLVVLKSWDPASSRIVVVLPLYTHIEDVE